MASATMAILRRNLVPLSVIEPWVARITAAARARSGGRDPFLVRGNPEAFLRALYLQLALAPRPPDVRSDLLLVLVDALSAPTRTSSPRPRPDRSVRGLIPASNLRP